MIMGKVSEIMTWGDHEEIIMDGITYLYVIYSSSGYFKIGITKNPTRRLKNIDRGTLTPFKNKYLVLVPLSDTKAPEMETMLHKRYAKKRVGGEWFDLDPFDIAFLAGLEARIGSYHIVKVIKGVYGEDNGE